jgi:hypothetical protein
LAATLVRPKGVTPMCCGFDLDPEDPQQQKDT